MTQKIIGMTAKPAPYSTPPAQRPFRAEAATVQRTLTPLEALYSRPSLAIEIGCGVGWHSIRWAQDNPDRTLLAVERTRAKFARFQGRLARHPQLKNLVPIHGDALRVLPAHLSYLNVTDVFILYPNPEPKAKSQRWIHMPFLDLLRDALLRSKPQTGKTGRLTVATNIESYADEIVASAAKRGWIVREDVSIRRSESPTFEPRTHFEKKYFDRGETLRELTLNPIRSL